MRLIGTLITLGLLGLAGYWSWHQFPQVRDFVEGQLASKDVLTLETRYSPEQILDAHRSTLLPGPDYLCRKAEALFYPYLLMEVKYTEKGRVTREGVMLWSLHDGEMVLDTASWEKTHGFEDCINTKAALDDYRIIACLAAHGNQMDREDLARELCVQSDVLERWAEGCLKKKLVVSQGSALRLHFDKPRLHVAPETHISGTLATKHVKSGVRLERRYQPSQVERASSAAFGDDFTIRKVREVFLPVYRIEVENPDGSVTSSCWNALTGKQMPYSYF